MAISRVRYPKNFKGNRLKTGQRYRDKWAEMRRRGPQGLIRQSEAASGQRVYIPHGAARELMYNRSPEILLAGPANTGKTIANLVKQHILATKYAGSRHLLARKTRSSLTHSAMVTFEERVLPRNTLVYFHGGYGEYRYPNGSVIVVGGMDKSSKIMSTEYDTAYIPEATELSQDDWEKITTRLRYGVVPYQQLLADCNPDSPLHWLYKRCMSGSTLMLKSFHRDNPVLWDSEKNDWTEFGRRYMEKLNRLTGVRLARLRDGEWKAAEGVIYDHYDPEKQRPFAFRIPVTWRRIWSIDWGVNDPFVFQAWAIDPENRMYLYRQIYRTGKITQDHADDVLALMQGDVMPEAIVCDHDLDSRLTFERRTGLLTEPAYKDILTGIDAVRVRMRPALDGRFKIFFMRDSLWEVDMFLADEELPTCTEDELPSYVWKPGAHPETPLQVWDHGCLVAGTLITTSKGEVPIETVKPGDQVLTRDGYKRVLESACTARNAPTVTAQFSDGRSLRSTGNHPIWIEGKGFMPLDTIRYTDGISILEDNPFWHRSRRLHSTAFCIAAILRAGISRAGTTSDVQQQITSKAIAPSTEMCGYSITAQFQKAMKCITKTAMHSTMRWPIWNVCPLWSIGKSTSQKASREVLLPTKLLQPMNISADRRRLQTGIDQRKAAPGIESTHSRQLLSSPQSARRVSNAASLTKCGSVMLTLADFAQASVKQLGDALLRLTTKRAPVTGVEQSSQWRSQSLPSAARVHVLSVSESSPADVYNLKVEGTPEYYANGVLTHNCDAMRYAVAYVDGLGMSGQNQMGQAPGHTRQPGEAPNRGGRSTGRERGRRHVRR